ncbi:MAG: carboxypeptidase regulatory-like domain-containing protein, partial [Armatimonadetes bacterium]|nr:carboxypeptidase regulatory-like domain-containing protein [Armatimonadota bacterium]
MRFLPQLFMSAVATALVALSSSAWAGPLDDTFSGATLDPKWTFTVYGDAQRQDASVKVENGQLVMVGGGSDIWGRADNGVYLWQAATGDFRITLKLVNLVPSSGSGIDASAKLGIMVRQDMDVAAQNVFSMSMPKGVHQQRRTTRGGDSAPGSGCPGANCNPWPSTGGNDDEKIPIWVRVTRTGNTFKMEMSNDGTTWQSAKVDPNHADNTATVAMTPTVLVGIGLTSHKTSDTAIATVDDFLFEQLNNSGPPAGKGFVVPAIVNAQGQVQGGSVTVKRDNQVLGSGFSGIPLLVDVGPVTATAGGMLIVANPVTGTVQEGKTAYLPIPATFAGKGVIKDLSTDAGQQWKAFINVDAAADYSARNLTAEQQAQFSDYGPIPDKDGVNTWDAVDPSRDIYGWLRTTVTIPAEHVGKSLVLHDWNFDDQDWTYWNGVRIGSTNGWNTRRSYFIPGHLVEATNTLAIRGRDGTGGGGISQAAPKLLLPNPTGIISGTITNSQNQPMPNVTLRAVSPNTDWGPITVTATTDAQGKYTLAPLGPGEYTVTIGDPAVIANPSTKTVSVAGDQTLPLDVKADFIPFHPDPLNTEKSDNFAGTTLNAKWTDETIGANATPGSARVENNSLVVEAGGRDIWGNADEGQFVSQKVTGDFVATVKVTSVPDTDNWSKVGIDVRASNAPGSIHAFPATSRNNGQTLMYRRATDGASARFANTGGVFSDPVWLRVERKGNAISGFWSKDGGATVHYLGTVELDLPAEVLVALAATSHTPTTTGIATFQDFKIGGIPVVETPTAPAAPTGVAATVNNNQLVVHWTAAAGAASYNFDRSTTANVAINAGNKINA